VLLLHFLSVLDHILEQGLVFEDFVLEALSPARDLSSLLLSLHDLFEDLFLLLLVDLHIIREVQVEVSGQVLPR
jgi:hypothetical protein